jgi:hypothetical protein
MNYQGNYVQDICLDQGNKGNVLLFWHLDKGSGHLVGQRK